MEEYTSLIVFIGIIIIATIIAFIVKNKVEKEKETVPMVKPVPVLELTKYMGEANPSQTNHVSAFKNATDTRPYYTVKKITLHERIYNKYPNELTNGRNYWIGLFDENKNLIAVKINESGIITDIRTQ